MTGLSGSTISSQTTRGLLTALLAALLTALVGWLDRSQTQAGLIALLVLTLTTGFFHGALDAVILLRQCRPAGRAVAWSLAYLVTVLLLGLAFAPRAGAALVLLLLLSVWHFGEPFGQTDGESALEKTVTRIVLGGAPVLLPVLTSAHQLESMSYGWINLNEQWAWTAWRALAWAWLALLMVWALRAWAYARPRWPAYRGVLAEVAVLAGLNLLLTPLMAFALYFGLYHAPVHIRRVGRACAIRNIVASPLALLTLGATLVLGAALLGWLGTGVTMPAKFSGSLTAQSLYIEFLIVALLALTVPHLVLVSYFATWLSNAPSKPLTGVSESI